jgi:hypothetical protein
MEVRAVGGALGVPQCDLVAMLSVKDVVMLLVESGQQSLLASKW